MKRSLTIATTLVATVLSTVAQANSIQIHTASFHYIPGNWRTFTPGVSYLHTWDKKFNISGGVFINSYGRKSEFLLAGQQLNINKTTKVRYGFGAVTGYWNPVNPYFALQLKYKNMLLTTAGTALTLGLELPLND